LRGELSGLAGNWIGRIMSTIISTPSDCRFVGNRVDVVTKLWHDLIVKAYPFYECVIATLPVSWLDDEWVNVTVRQQEKEQLFRRFTGRRWQVIPVEAANALPFYFLMAVDQKNILCPLRTPYWNLSAAQALALGKALGAPTVGFRSLLVYGDEALAASRQGVT
jgi:hypothetical protein